MNCLNPTQNLSQHFKIILCCLLLAFPIIVQANLFIIEEDSFNQTLQNAEARPFITIWKTDNPGTSADNQIIIPTDQSEDLALAYNYDIYWEEVDNPTNNGSIAGLTDNDTIDFPSPGSYRVEITGQFPKIYFNNTGDKSKILGVEQWGDIVWEDMRFAFRGCDQISIDAEDAPDLSQVTDMWAMFMGSNINENINHWDVSNVTNIGNLFRDAKQFNQPLDNWDVSNVTLMPQVFMGAEGFNQNIDNWDVSKVTNMGAMFNGAKRFNQDISPWDVSNVKEMHFMFQNTEEFNQDIGNWDVSNVINMNSMFKNTSKFNQYIGDWDVSNVENIARIFENALSFNSDLKNWKLTNTYDLSLMFKGAISFNQNLSNWKVGHITNMNSMFYDAINFDQDISSWDVGNVVNMGAMLRNCGLSPYHYDALLEGWLSTGVQDNIQNFQAHSLKYCTGEVAREILTQTHGWQFVADTKDCSQIILFSDLPEVKYNDPNFKLKGKVSSGAAIAYTSSNEDVAIVYGDSVKIIGAGITTIIAREPGNDYYSSATPVSLVLKVNKADQTIVFEPIEAKMVGDEGFNLNAVSSVGLNITYTSSVQDVAQVEGKTVTIIGAGATMIKALQEGDENYNPATPVVQMLQVDKKSQSIVFDALHAKTILDEDFNLTSDASSGLDVVYTSSNEQVAIISNNAVSIVGVGTTIITAKQFGNAEYAPAIEVSRELIITKVPQQITFEPILDMVANAPDFDIEAFVSSGLEVVLSIIGPATLEGKTVSLKGTPGIVSVTATQSGDGIYSSAEPIVRTFEVVAAPVTGIQDLRNEGISIYPNPVYEQLTIELGKTKQAVIYISDAGGNIVLEKRLEAVSNEVDFSSLSSGLYFIKVQLYDKVLYHKVVK